MRIRSKRAILVLLCMALVVGTGVWQASTSIPGLLFTPGIYNVSGAQHREAKDISSDFFTTMLGVIPEGSGVATTPHVGIQPMSLRPRSPSSPPDSWMSSALSSGASTNMTVNPALTSYSQLITRFPNQTNIFAPYFSGL